MPLKLLQILRVIIPIIKTVGKLPISSSYTLWEKYAITIMLTSVSSTICNCDELVSS